MKEPKEEPALETPALEETRTEKGRTFDSIFYGLIAITGQISFFGPVLILFLFCLLAVAPGVADWYFMRLSFLHLSFLRLLVAIPISAIVGLFLCLVLLCDNDGGRKKTGIVFSALADVFGLVFSVIMSIALLPFK